MSDKNGIIYNGNNGDNRDYSKNNFLVNLFDIKEAKDWQNGLENLLYFLVMDCQEDTQVSEIRDFYSDIFLLKKQFEIL